MDVFTEFLNWLIGGAADCISWVVGLLPQSPTADWVHNKPELVTLGYITWFIPFPTMILHFAAILTAIGAYYIYRVIARWLKVVRG